MMHPDTLEALLAAAIAVALIGFVYSILAIATGEFKYHLGWALSMIVSLSTMAIVFISIYRSTQSLSGDCNV